MCLWNRNRLLTFGLRQSGLWTPLSSLRNVRLTNGGSMYSTRSASMCCCPLATCLYGCQEVTSLNRYLWDCIVLTLRLVITRIDYSCRLLMRMFIRCSMSPCSNGIAVRLFLPQIPLRSRVWMSMRWRRFLRTVWRVDANGWSSWYHSSAMIVLPTNGCRRAT